jgi:hypothetical protein
MWWILGINCFWFTFSMQILNVTYVKNPPKRFCFQSTSLSIQQLMILQSGWWSHDIASIAELQLGHECS